MAVVGALIGTAIQAFGAMKQAKASKKAEALRERQMNLEAMRKKREMVREGVAARSQALSNATAQGAAEGSGLQGGIAQVTAQQNRNVQAVNQDTEIGAGIFKANRQYASGGMLVSLGSGVKDLGASIGNMTSSFKFG